MSALNNARGYAASELKKFGRPNSRNAKKSTDIKALSHAILDEIWNQKRRKWPTMSSQLTLSFTNPTLPSLVRGLERYKQCVRSYLNAFPDLHLTIEHQLTEGETVVSRGRRPEPIWAMGQKFLQPDDGLS